MSPTHQEYAEEIVRLLRSHHASARVAAVNLIRDADHDSVHALLEIARSKALRAAVRRALYMAAIVMASLTLTVTAVALFVNDPQVSLPLLQLLFVFFLGIAAVQAPADDDVAAALFEIDDPRAAGPIAESLDSPDTRWVAEEVLVRLLPRLRPADSACFNDAQRASLYRNLRRGNARFIVSCLQALQQIGDETALPHVKRLAEWQGGGSAAKRIREAAQATMPFLEMRLARERQRRTLLRSAPEPTDRLPRASQESTDRLPRIASEPLGHLLMPLRWTGAPPDRMVRPHPDED